jgi:KDO2-lipid IV(A) lauroyltransferase
VSLERIIKWASVLPLGLARGVGRFLGLAAWLFSSKYRRRFQDNWRLARPRFQAKAKGLSMFRALTQAGCLASELPLIWGRPSTTERMTIEGWEMVEALLAKGKGLIVLTPHLGAFELGARAFARRHPITVLYRPSPSPAMERLLQKFRPADNLTAVPANGLGVRALLRTLKSAGVVGILPDQVPSQGEGVWADFFGKPAYTMTLPVRLAQATDAPLIWVLAIRRPGGWSLVFKPWRVVEANEVSEDAEDGKPFVNSNPSVNGSDVAQAVQAMNHQLEALIALEPEQYLWGYNRYRGRRPDECGLSANACI